MTHLTESELARIADGSIEVSAGMSAHLASCAVCRDQIDAQTMARRVLAGRPITPVRDLSAAIRATLETERPWIERLNWRRLTLRVAPLAAALSLVALLLVRTADTAPDTSATTDAIATESASAGATTATAHTVASALWSGEVTDDQLLSLFLHARPDEPLSTYVQEK